MIGFNLRAPLGPCGRSTDARLVAGLSAALLLCLWPNMASAGFIVGGGSGNDNHANVLGVIQIYNSNNNPDLPTTFELFKKTDDDAAFVFNPVNGFQFFADINGTMPITSESELTSHSTAYFEYTGSVPLLYYSIKAGPNFNVWTTLPGMNELSLSHQEISHVTFWHAPEPSTWALATIGVAALSAARFRRWRSSKRDSRS